MHITLAEPFVSVLIWYTTSISFHSSYQGKYKNLHARLPVVVAETLLHANSEIELPLWLVHMFKVSLHGPFNLSPHLAHWLSLVLSVSVSISWLEIV